MPTDIEKQDRTVIVMAVAAILVAVIACVFAFFYFFNNNDAPVEPESQTFEFSQDEPEVVELPESDPVPVIPDTEPEVPTTTVIGWDTVVSAPGPSPVEGVTAPALPPSQPSVPPPTSYDEFIDSGLIWEDAPYEPPTVITPFSLAPQASQFVDPLAPVGNIDADNITDCGTIRINSSALNPSPASIISQLQRDSSTECMGDAIGNNCEDATATVTMSGAGGEVFVATRADGSCGLGLSTAAGGAQLCSLELVMDYVSTDDKTEAEWIDEFDSDPDGTMAMMVANMLSVAALVGTGFDCQLYSVQ